MIHKKNSHVIEIISKEKIDEGEDTFKNLSKICKLNYYSIETKNNNPILDVKGMNNIISKLLTK